jgi:hypothetical protein
MINTHTKIVTAAKIMPIQSLFCEIQFTFRHSTPPEPLPIWLASSRCGHMHASAARPHRCGAFPISCQGLPSSKCLLAERRLRRRVFNRSSDDDKGRRFNRAAGSAAEVPGESARLERITFAGLSLRMREVRAQSRNFPIRLVLDFRNRSAPPATLIRMEEIRLADQFGPANFIANSQTNRSYL